MSSTSDSANAKTVRIITSGKPYLDIDAYGGIIAYAELLRAQGADALAVSSSPFNESIPPKLRDLKVDFHTSLQPSPGNQFSVLDTSDPSHFDSIVKLDQVTEVIDHHPGYEDYWSGRPGVRTEIALFGAVCTQIYERWQKAGILAKMSRNSAVLLAAGILDNTLNFGAAVSTKTDKTAYSALTAHAGLNDGWPKAYFSDCERAILTDLETAVVNDLKILTFKSFSDKPVCVGQLVAWDADVILKSHTQLIGKVLEKQRPNWFMNLISLRDRSNRLLTNDGATKAWLTRLLDTNFQGNVATTSRPWLRKEIMKRDIDFAKS